MLSCWTCCPPANPPDGASDGEQNASPSQSNQLRLGFHKLSLPMPLQIPASNRGIPGGAEAVQTYN